MGKSKKSTKKSTTIENTTETTLVKLSYVETLAISQDLVSAEGLTETSGFTDEDSETATQRSGAYKGLLGGASDLANVGNLLNNILGKGKKSKTTVDTTVSSTGIQVKDQFLQPYFDRIRYSIGIKELSVSRFKFEPKSEIVSVPFFSPKEIVKVNIAVDEYIPPSFDKSQVWIEYYIKPEGTEDWIRVIPLSAPTRHNFDGTIIPKIVNFNLPKPTTAKLEDKYNYTEEPVKKLRFRAVISRPSGGNNDSITPMLKSYRLVMIPRA
jgi:hypothetical protein